MARTIRYALPLLMLAATTVGRADWGQLADNTWTRLAVPGIPVKTTAPGTQPLFYHLALAYYPPRKCFLLSDPDLGVWAFRYNPNAPMGTEVVGAQPLTVGQAALNPPAEGPPDVFRTYPSALNPALLDLAENTLLALGPVASGNEIRFHYDPENDITIVPGAGNIFLFDFKTKLWQEKTVEGGPGKLATHAGSLVWVPSLRGFLCFNKGRTLLYRPNDNAWTDLQPTLSPPAREIKMGLAYDSKNDIVLLVAGYKKWNEGPVKDMWAYRPAANTWEELKPEPVSGWFNDHYAGVGQTVYDSRHNVFLIGFESKNRMFAYRYKK